MDRQPEVNLLHPLATLAEWKEYSRMPVGMRDAQAVVLGDKVYIGGGDTDAGPSYKLLIYDFTTDSWDIICTPTHSYSLTVFRSQLVLVGGVGYCNTVTNKIWVLDKERQWESSAIPDMPTERFGTSAVSVGNNLIVAGGDKGGTIGSHLDVVEVYDGHKWRTVQPLPRPCFRMNSVVHEGFWYLAGGVDQGKKVFYASFGNLTAPESAKQTGVWVVLPDAPLERSTPVIFGMQLTTVGGLSEPTIHAYSHRTRTWVLVGNLPVAYGFSCSVVLPNGELLMVGRKTDQETSSHVFRTKVQVTSFPGGKFTLSALDRFEAASGISVYKQLPPEILPKMASTLQLDISTPDNPKHMFEKWISGKGSQPPTWETLLMVLLSIHHPLRNEIEDFFNRVTPEALSSLLEQKSKQRRRRSSSTEDPSFPDLMEVTFHRRRRREEEEEMEGVKKIKVDEESLQRREEGEKMVVRFVGRSRREVAEEQEPMEAREKELQRCHDDREADMWRNKSLMAQNEELRRQLQCIQPGSIEITGYLRGVDITAETSVQVTNQAQTFTWTGYGLKLNIPPGALPADLEECRLLMKVGLSGQFELPQNTSLVSAVYWLDSEPRCKFSKHLTLEIQHCVKNAHTSNLSFVRARCTQTHLPYKFEDIERGVFTSGSAYGSVELDQFSGVGIVDENPVSDRVYCAFLYYLRRGINQRDIHFVITWNSEPHTTVVQQEYTARGATTGPDLPVEFESNSISLQLPTEGITLEDGWRIIPLFNPEITREKVDNFMTKTETGRIPSCQLTAVWTRQSKPPVLVHQVTLKGAKESSNFFSIVLDCDSIPPDRGGEITARNVPGQGQHRMLPASLDSEPKLPDLMNEVAAKTPGKWRDIGLQLGLDQGVLDGIATISPRDFNLCYSNIFTLWKNQNSTTHPYTWSTIVDVLQAPSVGQERLASKIKNKLTGPPPQ